MIFGLFSLGISVSNLEGLEKLELLPIHVTGGFVLFVLTTIRSIMFFYSKRPEDLKTGSKINDKLIVWIHNAFYILLQLIGVTGIVTIKIGGYGIALDAQDVQHIVNIDFLPSLKTHTALAYLTMLLVALHIVGVVKHYVLVKENSLKRII
jgi:cytochrome b561